MKVERLPPVRTSLGPTNHPYMTGPWTPQHEEVNAWDLEVLEGAIPADLDGVYLRNTENPVHDPVGRYHPFDGDGMIHQIEFKNGQATYRNRFVRTRCFEAEQEVNEGLWGGLMDGPGTSKRPGFGAHGSLKDTASTDIVVHNGEAIATFYQCGEAYRLDPLTLENLGVASWAPLEGVSAHPKVDEATGELMFFNYSKAWPYMHYGVVGADGIHGPLPECGFGPVDVSEVAVPTGSNHMLMSVRMGTPADHPANLLSCDYDPAEMTDESPGQVIRLRGCFLPQSVSIPTAVQWVLNPLPASACGLGD